LFFPLDSMNDARSHFPFMLVKGRQPLLFSFFFQFSHSSSIYIYIYIDYIDGLWSRSDLVRVHGVSTRSGTALLQLLLPFRIDSVLK
jgi:hypothetical protein